MLAFDVCCSAALEKSCQRKLPQQPVAANSLPAFFFTFTSLLYKFPLIITQVDCTHVSVSSLPSLLLKDLSVSLSFGKFPDMPGLLTFILKNAAYTFSLLFALSFVTFCSSEDLYKFLVVNSSVFPFDLRLERLYCPCVTQTYNKTFRCFI